ncbi:hypothetical protein GF108_17590 [Phyllobacterium sp. SYP-B3895]|uniref:acyl-homoserine-lactone synthase n=1 Tax=Phyllobacterium sp. SYP-B3895 TaxID=2663240 RepID=UPI001299D72A|nr:acyl-homoserine-lactone synthase [Phyllobacterium sp. SYP-B3895]MRG57389.1 hypothetical protein [Phyllobacterium sp. SYP-B3895]
MIYVIGADDYISHNHFLDQMFRLRARVFKDRLNWDVQVQNGREIDRFDTFDPLYLTSINEQTGRLQGSLRLLPTTGPNMLRDVFGALLPDGEFIESPLIWESSRFCIDPDLAAPLDGRLNSVTTELFCGVVEVGLFAGLDTVVSVYDARMARIFRRANWAPRSVGLPTYFGGILTHAGMFEISDIARKRLVKAGDRPDPVIMQLNPSPALFLNAQMSNHQ